MYFVHPEHPDRRVALGYCLNVFVGEDLAAFERGLAQTCSAVRERVAPNGTLGIGLYLPASVAMPLAEDRAAGRRRELRATLDRLGLAVFTANAFPFGGFHRPGLKANVFRPTWDERERALFTAAVAVIAHDLVPSDATHLSISTHSGLHRDDLPDDPTAAAERVHACGRGLGLALAAFDVLSQGAERRTILAIEPEPRSLAGDTRQLSQVWPALVDGARAELAQRGVTDPDRVIAEHLGVCLDTCHAAVEFESTDEVVARLAALGAPIGKVQIASALRLPNPGADDEGRTRLLSLDEPVYLHQVTGRTADGDLVRAGDLGELAEGRDAAWDACEEWRCHFHVPVDAPATLPGAGGLGTTAREGAALLGALLDDPTRWGTRDLHAEVETYTFDVLPDDWRRDGLAAALARELDWTRALLAEHGWTPASDG